MSTPEVALIAALLALLGVLVNALITANNARKSRELDQKLVRLKAQLDQLNAVDLIRVQSEHSERLKTLEFTRAQRAADDERKRQTDAATLAAILTVIPARLIQFLKQHDFGGTFNREELAPLDVFLSEAASPDREFLINELETLRTRLLESGRNLSKLIGFKTFPREHTFSSVLPAAALLGPRPDWVDDNASELNNAAEEFVSAFEELVRSSRARLGN